MEKNKIYLGDCLELMPKHVKNKSIDMIFCDLPYGTTACKWDTIIPFDKLWSEYERVIKDNGAIVLFASQPFTSNLIMSNPKLFRYEWIWKKTLFSNFALVKKQPAKLHENICVFYKKQPTYNPQMIEGKPYTDKVRGRTMGVIGDAIGQKKAIVNKGTRYPSTIQKYSNGNNGNVHPTQKPLDLIEYMIKTYTNEGDLILDNTCGSGTTGLGAKNLNRDYVMMEQDEIYYEIANKRLED